MTSFKDLIVWQRACELCVASYRLSSHLPPEERYGLRAQLCRASVSVCTNIAEGHARYHRQEYAHHLSIALGSLAECETLVTLSEALGHASADEAADVLAKAAEVGRMLFALSRKIRSLSRVPARQQSDCQSQSPSP